MVGTYPTCKDCIHEKVCFALIKSGLPYDDNKHPAEAFCMTFKNKADIIEIKHGKNISKNHPVDEFICSECGLIMRDLTEVRIDEDNEDELYYEFEFAYCPNCGAKIN